MNYKVGLVVIIIISQAMFFGGSVLGQGADFLVNLESLEVSNSPAVHSYSWGKTSDGKWLIIGGRIDGLHRRQPWASFWEEHNNHAVFLIDPVEEMVWSADMDVLPAPIYEQLQSTNQEFVQRENFLYIVGGYGYSATADDHQTYPYLTAISVDELAEAIINGGDITPWFRQIDDEAFKVTGGQMGLLDDTFYLVGGQLFDGLYNPMGPDMGPGFVQGYTNAIRRFELVDDGVTVELANYEETVDAANLHRRDYNMCPQIFPNGEEGFTVFSGVFDTNDMPWLTTVDVGPDEHELIEDFNQNLSQYHSAKLPIYNSEINKMQTIFFGGMSQFSIDEEGNLVQDDEVPFVKTISMVSRNSDGEMSEIDLDYIEMPALLGAGAEFIPAGNFYFDNGILDLMSLPNAPTLVGYIYGGIESSAPNIFFINDGTQSYASNKIFEVIIDKSNVQINESAETSSNSMHVSVFPNPVSDQAKVIVTTDRVDPIVIEVFDTSGRKVHEQHSQIPRIGSNKIVLDTSKLNAGSYALRVAQAGAVHEVKFLK